MLQPYRINVGTPENPQWVPGTRRGEDPSCEDAKLGFTKLDAAKWNIHVHSLGDRAVRVSLDNYELAKKKNRRWDRRHTITHMQYVDEKDLPRFGKLGVVASMSLRWSRRDAWSVQGIDGHIAPEAMDKLYPANSVRKGAAVVAYGSDWPVTDLMPWVGIETGVTRTGEVDEAKAVYPGMLAPASERLSVIEFVKASTIGVAHQLHRDDMSGSIERGKLADRIVVDQKHLQGADLGRLRDQGPHDHGQRQGRLQRSGQHRHAVAGRARPGGRAVEARPPVTVSAILHVDAYSRRGSQPLPRAAAFGPPSWSFSPRRAPVTSRSRVSYRSRCSRNRRWALATSPPSADV